MVAGIRIKNSFGTMQIDETYFNLTLISKNTVNTFVPPIGGPTYSSAVIAINGVSTEPPIIAIVSPTPAIVSNVEWNAATAPNQWSVTIMANTATVVTITYYVFNRSQTPPPRVGVIVRNAAGQIVFHSDEKLMRVTDFVDITTAGAGTRTYTAGRQYAWMTSVAGYYWKPVGGGQLQYGWMACAITGGNTANFQQCNRARSAGSVAGGNDRLIGLIIDVTGY